MSAIGSPRWVGPVLGTAVVLGAMVGLHALGAGILAAPPMASTQQFFDWVQATEPTTIGMVAVRLLALGVGYHLIVTTALGVIGRLLRRPGLIRLAEWSTLPPFRGTVRRIAGISLSASAALVTPLQTAGANTTSPATHQQIALDIAPAAGQATANWRSPTTGPTTATLRLVDRQNGNDPHGQATLRPVDPQPTEAIDHPGDADPADGDPDQTSGGGGGDRQPASPAPQVPPSSQNDMSLPRPAPAPDQHGVRPGDHLWAIAEARLASNLDRAPTDAEIDPYWRAVVAANPDLTDPDLLMPGSVINVPTPPPKELT